MTNDRTFRLAPAAALLSAMLATGSAQAQLNRGVPEAVEGVDVEERPDAQLPLQLEFADESGRTVALGEYFRPDRPVLLVLAYYRCPMLCSLVLGGVVSSLKEIDWVAGEEFEIVTLSIDPLDVPKLAESKKQEYLRRYGEPAAARGWHFLTGREAEISRVADAVGFRYRYLEDRQEYAHPAVIFIATPEGRVSRYLYGVEYDPRTVRLSLVEASEGRIGTTMDRILLYCYHYDPKSGQYTPVAMNIMRLAGTLTVLVLAVILLLLWRRDVRKKRISEARNADV